jgi:hypothetical protein
MTNEINLAMILQTFQSKTALKSNPLMATPAPSSSNIVMEVTYSSGDFYVQVTYNDSPIVLGGCSTATTCKASNFVEYLS